MVLDRGKLPAEKKEKLCPYCFKVIWQRDDETLGEWKKRKTCGAAICRYVRPQRKIKLFDEKPSKVIQTYHDRAPLSSDTERWDYRPDFSKYNIKEKPSHFFKMMKPETFIPHDE